MAVLSELRNRGVQDVCIVVCDGVKGLLARWRDRAQGHRPDLRDPPNQGLTSTVVIEGPLQAGAGHQGHRHGPTERRAGPRPVRRLLTCKRQQVRAGVGRAGCPVAVEGFAGVWGWRSGCGFPGVGVAV